MKFKKKMKFAPIKCVVTSDGETYFIDANSEEEVNEMRIVCEQNSSNLEIKVYKGDGEGAYFLQNEAKRKIGFNV